MSDEEKDNKEELEIESGENLENVASEGIVDGPDEKDNEGESEDDPKKKKKKKKFKKHIPLGNAYVKATFNNTIITITDTQGNKIASGSAGGLGYSGSKKSTPYVAGLIASDVANKAKTVGMVDVNVYVKGVGSGRESAVRSLQTGGLNIIAVRDVTPLPHNGCRRKKARRV